MSAQPELRKTLQRPWIVAALLVLAVSAWGAILLFKTSPEQRHLEAGVEYARLRQGSKAEREWLAATVQDSSDSRPWEYLSEYYFDTHNWSAAADALHQVQRLNPTAPHLAARLAASSLNAGDEQAAYHNAEDALKQDPNDAETIALFCGLLAKTGEDKRRIDLLHHLVTLRPENLSYQTILAEALISKALYADARPVVETVLQHDPQNDEAHALRGMILLNTDPSPQGVALAESDLLSVLSTPHYAAFAHFNLGKLYKRQGQPQKAVPHLEAAARALPDKREVFFELADAYAQTGQTQKAAQARRQSEALDQKDKQTHSSAGGAQ